MKYSTKIDTFNGNHQLPDWHITPCKFHLTGSVTNDAILQQNNFVSLTVYLTQHSRELILLEGCESRPF